MMISLPLEMAAAAAGGEGGVEDNSTNGVRQNGGSKRPTDIPLSRPNAPANSKEQSHFTLTLPPPEGVTVTTCSSGSTTPSYKGPKIRCCPKGTYLRPASIFLLTCVSVLGVTFAVLYWNYNETMHRRMTKKQVSQHKRPLKFH